MRKLFLLFTFIMASLAAMATTKTITPSKTANVTVDAYDGDTFLVSDYKTNVYLTTIQNKSEGVSNITIICDSATWIAASDKGVFRLYNYVGEPHFTFIFNGESRFVSNSTGDPAIRIASYQCYLEFKAGIGSVSSVKLEQTRYTMCFFGYRTSSERNDNVNVHETTDIVSITDQSSKSLTLTEASTAWSSSVNKLTCVFAQKDLTKEYHVSSEENANVTITTNKSKAVYGDTITVSCEPVESTSYVTEVYFTDSVGNKTIISGNQFVMPLSDVTIGATVVPTNTIPFNKDLTYPISTFGFGTGTLEAYEETQVAVSCYTDNQVSGQLFIPVQFEKGKNYECTVTSYLNYNNYIEENQVVIGIGSSANWESMSIKSDSLACKNTETNTHTFAFTADADYSFFGIGATVHVNALAIQSISISEVDENAIPIKIGTTDNISLSTDVAVAAVGDSVTVTVNSVNDGYVLYEIYAETALGEKIEVSKNGKFEVPSCAYVKVKATLLKIIDPISTDFTWSSLTKAAGPGAELTTSLSKGEYTILAMLSLRKGSAYSYAADIYKSWDDTTDTYSFYLGDSLLYSYSASKQTSFEKQFIATVDTTILFRFIPTISYSSQINSFSINGFDINKIPVTYNYNTNLGTVSGLDTVKYGDTVKVTIEPKESVYTIETTANNVPLNEDSTFVAPLQSNISVNVSFLKAITPTVGNTTDYFTDDEYADYRLVNNSIDYTESTFLLNITKGKSYEYRFDGAGEDPINVSLNDSVINQTGLGVFTATADTIYKIKGSTNYMYAFYINQISETVYIYAKNINCICEAPALGIVHDTIQFKVRPNDGYKMVKIILTDKYGNSYPCSIVNDSIVKFEVPTAVSNIQINAYAAKIHEVTHEQNYVAPITDDVVLEENWFLFSNCYTQDNYLTFSYGDGEIFTALQLNDSIDYQLNTSLYTDYSTLNITLYDSLWNEVKVFVKDYDTYGDTLSTFSIDKSGIYFIGIKSHLTWDMGHSTLTKFEVSACENAITILPTENGTVTCPKTYTTEGTSIKLSINADMGYQLAAIEITDTLSNVIPMAEDSSFTMPNSDVNISATFEKRVYNIIDSTAKNTDCSIEIQAEATMNEFVSFTITLANGYQLDTLYVLDENGTKILVPEAPVIVLPIVTPGLTPQTPIEEQSTSTDYIFLMPASNVTVYAEYSKINYTIDATEASADDCSLVLSDTTATIGQTITINDTVLAEGYQIDTLYVLDENGNEVVLNNNSFVMPASNVTVHASYSKSVYSIDMTDAQSTNCSVSVSPTSASIDDIVHIVSIKPAKGYQIDTLYVLDENGDEIALNNKSFVMPASNVTVHATFSKIIYSIDATDAEHDDCYITLSDSTATFGQTITINDTILAAGYQLDDIYILNENENGISINDNSFVMPAGNVTVHATFSKIDFTIDATDTEANDCYIIFDKTEATVNETVKVDYIDLAEGYQIDTLYVLDENGEKVALTDSSFVMPASNVTIHATYSKVNTTSVSEVMKEDVTLSSNEGTIYCNRSFNIYTISGVDVTKRNGSLQGVYLVKVGSNVYKVIVK